MNLESRKYHLIEQIVALQDESLLKKMEQIVLEKKQPTTIIRKVVQPKTKENGIVQRRSIYRISDRPSEVVAPKKIIAPAKVTSNPSHINSSLGKLQRLVRERALANHTLDT